MPGRARTGFPWGSYTPAVALLRVLLVAIVVLAGAACAPTGTAPEPSGDAAGDPVLLEGRAIWVDKCQRCHGPTGDGGAGPRLAGRISRAYPEPAAQAEVVRNGKGSGMPAWKAVLTDAQIDAVVQYTRRVL